MIFFKRQLVRLHLDGNRPSPEGILLERPGQFYRIAKAVLHVEDNQSHNIEGELWIPRDKVLFMQVLSE